MENTNQMRPELLQVADILAREKGISRDDVLEAMEVAISKAGRSKYGPEYDVRVSIDRKTGEIKMARYIEIVEEVENEMTQTTLDKVPAKYKDLKVGDFIIDPLPPMDFGRIAAQTAKQVVVQKIRDAERMQQFSEFKDKVGEIVHGTVKRVELGNVIIDLGRAEAVLRRDELIPNETFRPGDRVRAYLMDVRSEVRGPQIFLSRSHPQFLAKLFAGEVPEVYDGIIEIKSVARDAGSRAKVAVWSKDNTIDPRGACIGMRGVRVQAIVTELQGEKIDVVHWSSDPAAFIVNAFAPSEILKIVLDEETKKAEVVVSDEQLSQAIGRRGQNVRLASILTGWHIDVLNAEQEAENRQKEEKGRLDLFMQALDVDDMIAHLLIQEGFTKIEEIAFVELDELSSIDGFDEALAKELQSRAATYLTQRNEEMQNKIKEYDLADDLKNFEGLTLQMLEALGANQVKTLDDLADLAADELVEIVGAENISLDDANTLIMKAREHWFDEEKSEN
ncbi:MAG: transcription termination/antitermination protein NusA [Alphaproteobacteria bacterium]|nr:transcription termination/antitermination protein NusA [Alphaproteobacteria bacterium]